MVAPITPRLDFVPEVNLARCFLFRAQAALEKGALLEAGCLLREAVRRQLWAECCWKNCLPKGVTERTGALVLLKALRKAGHIKKRWDFEIMEDSIRTANKLAHCGRESSKTILWLISTWHEAIDNDPCGESFVRTAKYKPAETGCDCDDSDPADW